MLPNKELHRSNIVVLYGPGLKPVVSALGPKQSATHSTLIQTNLNTQQKAFSPERSVAKKNLAGSLNSGRVVGVLILGARL